MINKVILIGNLGADPEVRYTQSSTPVASFRMATTERWRNQDGQQQEQTEWHRIVAWGKLAEICGQYLHKGSKVYIEGKLQTRKWQDQSGQDRYTTEVIAREMKMLDSRGGSGGGGGDYGGDYGGGNYGGGYGGSGGGNYGGGKRGGSSGGGGSYGAPPRGDNGGGYQETPDGGYGGPGPGGGDSGEDVPF